jgi:hypothetical protein
VLECGECEGESTAPLHSRSVRCDELNFRSSTLTFGSTTKLQHIPPLNPDIISVLEVLENPTILNDVFKEALKKYSSDGSKEPFPWLLSDALAKKIPRDLISSILLADHITHLKIRPRIFVCHNVKVHVNGASVFTISRNGGKPVPSKTDLEVSVGNFNPEMKLK